MIGKEFAGVKVHDTADLEKFLGEGSVDIGVVAVPAEMAQDVIDRLVKCGVHAILNYAPIAAHVPRGVQIKRIDPVLSLQGMTYYLKARSDSAK